MKENYYKPWTFKEDKFLKDNYNTMNLSELARKLKRTESSIMSRASLQGYAQRKRLWSDEDIALLKKKYPTHCTIKLEEQLDRYREDIVTKANSLGLSKEPARYRVLKNGMEVFIGTSVEIKEKFNWNDGNFQSRRRKELYGYKIDKLEDEEHESFLESRRNRHAI